MDVSSIVGDLGMEEQVSIGGSEGVRVWRNFGGRKSG
jgi:hypothetical protein